MAAQLNVIRMREGDTLPLLRINIDRVDGDAQDFTGYTVRLRISKTGGGYVEKTATLQTSPAGQYFLITWDESDLMRGSHMGAITFVDADGRKLTTRNILFEVAPPIE
jgi:hypothetical protein